MSDNQPNSRYVALKMCLNVIEHGRSLSQTLAEGLAQFSDRRERAFTQNLVLGTLRWQERLAAIRAHLLKKPLKAKDEDVNQLILIGLYQILYMDTPEHAAVSETVTLTQKLKKPWAKALVNGVLRNFLRDAETIQAEVDLKPAYKFSHPQWFTKAMRKAYPDDWQAILTANNEPAPLSLRVNTHFQPLETFKAALEAEGVACQTHPYSPAALVLEQALDITQLPTYDDGGFSVQDIAAQQAAYILNPQPNERVLDACAAPGGKTTHLLELANNQLDLLALEKEPERIERLSENLHRLQLDAEVDVGDASQPDDWWNGTRFDKILLDAPCSATGIIRRHPDIKWHRTMEDIEALVETQSDILRALWQTLKPGGRLLYSTCSVMPQENGLQMEAFLAETADAKEIPIEREWGFKQDLPGKQILPGSEGMDGFYYCLLEKSE
ncbi:16S rRNA (cytosine(967)-C(5))-methyltransferase RsmB [Hydrogenovibrio marinus]|uniref:16S rRNA (cytosine(967)-C(5))-methyltransferase n=1 Tax=Hydrogenovibrio marinus TaxID=28885 RepID=A0A066ZZS0_HYDMR|nr:16S rRNA (cytosine(967)-C(5))-methyltransferase RsmB [Hydrogenovibrio marinus]KDN95856.1 sun protein [Hydrogenovibrio marinus]BBN58657.1 ribosomal RNA small subunit methyltransferase B [Hydrogenovibrio marinus]